MSQAIRTKLLFGSGNKPNRIKATCDRGSLVYAYDQYENAHREAAEALVAKFIKEDRKANPNEKSPWRRRFYSGSLSDGSWAHVFKS